MIQLAHCASGLHLAGFLHFLLFFLSFFPIITPYSFFVRAGDIPSSARRQTYLCILRIKIKDYNNLWWPYRLPWQRSEIFPHFGVIFEFKKKCYGLFLNFELNIRYKKSHRLDTPTSQDRIVWRSFYSGLAHGTLPSAA